MLGFADVYDYVPGKVDWLAHNLEVEGDDPEPPTVGGLMRDDVVRCAPTDRAGDMLASIKASPYPFALVTSEGGTVLGRLPASALTRVPRSRSGISRSPGRRRSVRTSPPRPWPGSSPRRICGGRS